jgi:hypothetical protein
MCLSKLSSRCDFLILQYSLAMCISELVMVVVEPFEIYLAFSEALATIESSEHSSDNVQPLNPNYLNLDGCVNLHQLNGCDVV